MTDIGSRASRRRVGYAWLAVCPLAAGAIAMFIAMQPAFAAVAPVGLGTAGSFGVLAGTTVTNTGLTFVEGDLGVSPGTAVTGFPPGIVFGSTHAGDAVAGDAQNDLTTAYNDAAGRNASATVGAFIGAGQTLAPGVYKATSSLEVGGALTLDAQGNAASVFIFQAASTLITDSASHIILTDGAQACNVFWQVGSSATLGTYSQFQGSILALTSIAVTTGDTITGRALARNGAVTLDDDRIIVPGCATTSPTPTTTITSPSTSTAPTPTSPAPTSNTTSPAPKPNTTSPAPTPTSTRYGPPPTTSPAPTRYGPPPATPAPVPSPVGTPFPVTG
jgi:Ice-binding-like